MTRGVLLTLIGTTAVVIAGAWAIVTIVQLKIDLMRQQYDCEQVVAKARSDNQEVHAALDSANIELGAVKSSLAEVQGEIKLLKQTPAYYFDQAVAKMKESEDEQSLKLFSDFLSRFPNDPLAQQARLNVEQIESKMKAAVEAEARARKEKVGKICTLLIDLTKGCEKVKAEVIPLYRELGIGDAYRAWEDGTGLSKEVWLMLIDFRRSMVSQYEMFEEGWVDGEKQVLGEKCVSALQGAATQARTDCLFNGRRQNLNWIRSTAMKACN